MERRGITHLRKNVFSAGIVLFWVVMMSLLVFRHYGNGVPLPSSGKTSLSISDLPADEWFGIYLRGEKIGVVSHKVTPVKEGGEDFYDITENMQLNLRIMDRIKNIRSAIEARHTRDFKLLSFSARILSDAEIEVHGTREDGLLRLTIQTNGNSSTVSLNIDQATSLNLAIIPQIIRTGLTEGRTLHIPLLDPFTRQLQDIKIEVGGRESVIAHGVTRECYKLNAFLGDVRFSFWVTETGEILRQESPLGFVLVKETRETAQKTDMPSRDLINYLSVPFSERLRPDLGYLKIRLKGISVKDLDLDGGRQALKKDILEIRREDLANIREERISHEMLKEYLSDTPLIQARDSRIRDLALRITAEEPSAIKKAGAINRWIYRNLKKVPSLTVPDALQVLSMMQGDCNEHTTLFVALARASGLPARTVVGLVHKEGAFFYHAWPEFFVGQWIAADPTFGQFPADASHIRLLVGDLYRQVRILPVIGHIQIERLAYR